MSTQIHRRRKIEVIVEAPLARAVIEWLGEQGVRGYSMIPRVSGGGQRGERLTDDVTKVFENVLIIAIAPENLAQQILLGFHSRFPNVTGIVYLSDVEVARSEHF